MFMKCLIIKMFSHISVFCARACTVVIRVHSVHSCGLSCTKR